MIILSNLTELSSIGWNSFKKLKILKFGEKKIKISLQNLTTLRKFNRRNEAKRILSIITKYSKKTRRINIIR